VDVQVYVQRCDSSSSSQDVSTSRLYDAGFLKFMRMSKSDDKVYIRSQCRAEMRKAVLYNVDVVTHTDANIIECQCECAAGMGPKANCKHVRAVLCGLCDFTRTRRMKTESTCTEKLQTFHKSKPYFGSPVKAQGLRQHKAKINSSASFDPRPQNALRGAAYCSRVRNLAINFTATTSHWSSGLNMLLLQMYGPANPYALEVDHDYGEIDSFQSFLLQRNVITATLEVATDIEHRTRGQATNPDWHEERSLRLCSSNFGRICKAQSTETLQRLAKSLVSQQSFSTRATRHGILNEQPAVTAYEKTTGNTVRSSGLVISVSHPFIASSPDGIVGDLMVVEVKCPYVSRLKAVTAVTVPFLSETDGKLSLKSNHDYYYQIQGQLYTTNRHHCELVVYTLVDMKVVPVMRDDSFVDDMVDKLVTFFIEYFKPALKEQYWYRNYKALQCNCHAMSDT